MRTCEHTPARSSHDRCSGPRRARTGFTLLELLVVVAIIALLMAILLPSLSAAREQSRRVVCASNLHQITLAWHMYLDESKGRFPTGLNVYANYGGFQGQGAPSFGSNPSSPRPKPLNRYLHLPLVLRTGGAVFTCPSDRGLVGVRPTAWRYYGTSYYPNNLLIGRQVYKETDIPCEDLWTRLVGDDSASPPIPSMIAGLIRWKIDNDSLVILMGDSSWYEHWYNKRPDRFPWWHSRPGMHNIAFMDGHGDYVRIRKGIYVDGRYTTIPFKGIRAEFAQCQTEVTPGPIVP